MAAKRGFGAPREARVRGCDNPARTTVISPAHASLARARAYSLEVLEIIAGTLETGFGEVGVDVAAAVVGGSLGRLEGSPASDVDLIVLVDSVADGPELIPPEVLAEACSGAGLRPPKADGIYGRPVSVHALVDPGQRGSLSESPAVFGSRMGLLLDGRPVCRATRFEAVRAAVVDWYDDTHAVHAWTHLFNDLTRYLHAYAVWQQFKYTRSPDDGWYLRQAKFRSSRLVTFAGLLFLLAENCAQANGAAEWLVERLDMTPLERLLFVFSQYRDGAADRILDNYDAVHERLADPDVRAQLIAASPDSAATAVECAAYAEIHALTASLHNDLTRFVLARRDDWPLDVFRNWLL